jgi:hypothetical protein
MRHQVLSIQIWFFDFQLVFFVAGGAEKIRNGSIGFKLTDPFRSTVRTIQLVADPPFGPRPRPLRAARIGDLRFFKP